MPNTLIKVGAGIVGISSVTTGSYFIRGYYNTERISHRINNAGMTLLNYYDSEQEWAKRWREYVKDSNNVWQLANFDQIKQNQDKVPKSFKDKCYYSISTAIEGSEALAGQIEKYCTKSYKLADLLAKEKGIKLIEAGDNEGWQNAWKNYLANRKNKDPLDIKSSVRANSLPREYSSNCITKSNRQIKSLRDEDYSIVKEWCTKKT